MADPKSFRFECECGEVVEVELGGKCPKCGKEYADEHALEVASEALVEKEEEARKLAEAARIAEEARLAEVARKAAEREALLAEARAQAEADRRFADEQRQAEAEKRLAAERKAAKDQAAAETGENTRTAQIAVAIVAIALFVAGVVAVVMI